MVLGLAFQVGELPGQGRGAVGEADGALRVGLRGAAVRGQPGQLRAAA